MSSTNHLSDLLSSSKARFDELVEEDELFYEPNHPERLNVEGYDFELRIVKAFNRKPILSASDPSRKKAGGPLSDPEEKFVLAEINANHLLQLNKYCIYRPQFILHPRKFAPQTDDLSEEDFAAAWAVLDRLKEPFVVFFNCGVDAGSSQGHKHLQLTPKPPPDEFILFPERPEMKAILSSCLSQEDAEAIEEPEVPPNSLHVPFACRVLSIPAESRSGAVVARYRKLMEWFRQHEPSISSGSAYNVVFTREWICVIPRRHAGIDGINGNAMGMMGLVWVKDQEEADDWATHGWTRHLEALGMPST